MGYSLLAYTADARLWVVARGRHLSDKPWYAMYYPNPSSARVTAEAMHGRSIGDLQLTAFHIVGSREVTTVWNAPQLLPPPLDIRKTPRALLAESTAVIDRLNGQRIDLAMLVQRLIRRLDAARRGEGTVTGDDQLVASARDYLRRKGLEPNTLREDNSTTGAQNG